MGGDVSSRSDPPNAQIASTAFSIACDSRPVSRTRARKGSPSRGVPTPPWAAVRSVLDSRRAPRTAGKKAYPSNHYGAGGSMRARPVAGAGRLGRTVRVHRLSPHAGYRDGLGKGRSGRLVSCAPARLLAHAGIASIAGKPIFLT